MEISINGKPKGKIEIDLYA